MAAGIQPTKDDINFAVGAAALNLKKAVDGLKSVKAFLDTKTDSDLTTGLGFVQADVDTIRSALTDSAQLAGLYEGTGTLGTAKDFRTFMKLLYGFGY